MEFKVVGDIKRIETIAVGSGIRERARLRKIYGKGRWRKRKGFAEIRLASGGDSLENTLMAKASKRLYICLNNNGYEVSLERRKIYVGVPDAQAERHGHLRIIDESGEDYLYPSDRFVPAELPLSTRRAVLQAA